MVHTCHKHEPPVLNLPIQIAFENDDYLIINKPPSIPLHPCGAYKFNTVLYVLAKEYNKKNLFTVHRLDRLTSGLIMICKNKTMAYETATLIQNEKVHKTYLARVDGIFPKNEEEWLKSNPDNSLLRKYIKWEDDKVKISIPTQPLSKKESIYACNENGKNTETVFKYRSDNGTTSVVECYPLTGRTHQIRLHLEWFKHPIANDPHYNHKMRVSRIKKSHLPFELEDFSSMTKGEKDWNKLCPFCKVKNEGKDEMDEAFNDIELSWKYIWLHALQYEYKDHWCYKVDQPDWAKPDFNGVIRFN